MDLASLSSSVSGFAPRARRGRSRKSCSRLVTLRRYVKVRYRGLAKNTAQIKTLFALANLWMVRKQILQGTPG
jgi:IS5 family transposase